MKKKIVKKLIKKLKFISHSVTFTHFYMRLLYNVLSNKFIYKNDSFGNGHVSKQIEIKSEKNKNKTIKLKL